MSSGKYRVVLRERPINGLPEEEWSVELKSIKDLLERLTNPYEMHLYLGMYDLGEIVGWEKDYIDFEGLLSGNISLLLEEWSPRSISKERIENVLNHEFTLEEFLKYIWADQNLQFMLVDNPYDAWKLLQEHWNPCVNVKEIINPKLADEGMVIKEQRILFLK